MAKNIISQGTRLREFWQHSRMSMRELAQKMGYKNSSSIQRYLSDEYGQEGPLDITLATKFASALAGTGTPPIEYNDVMALAGAELTEGGHLRATSVFGVLNLGSREVDIRAIPSDPRETALTLPRDLPIYGTALGSNLDLEGNGDCVAIEQTYLSQGEAIDYMRRPPSLIGRTDVYVAHIVGSSMLPKFSEGQRVLVETRRPPRSGDDVIVQLVKPLGEDGEEMAAVLIKTLRRRTADYVELEQYNPAATFRLPSSRIRAVHRVVPWDEVLVF